MNSRSYPNYYKLLGVSSSATTAEIKSAFRKCARETHPDVNSSPNAKEEMQQLIEAKLILLDVEARLRYDVFYRQFYESKNRDQNSSSQEYEREAEPKEEESSQRYKQEDTHYTKPSYDPILDDWMKAAREQAAELVNQAILDFKEVSNNAAKGVAQGLSAGCINFIVGSIIFAIFGALIRAC